MADYTTPDLVASALGAANTDTTILTNACTAASRIVDSMCGRPFGLGTAGESRVYEPSNWSYCRIDDAAVITAVKTDDSYNGTYGTTWSAATEYITEPLNGVGPSGIIGWPITALVGVGIRWFPMWGFYRKRTVQVTGTFGWAAVPDEVAQAALLLAEELFKSAREAPLGTAGLDAFGPVPIRGNRRVDDLLAPYKSDTAAGSPFLLV